MSQLQSQEPQDPTQRSPASPSGPEDPTSASPSRFLTPAVPSDADRLPFDVNTLLTAALNYFEGKTTTEVSSYLHQLTEA